MTHNTLRRLTAPDSPRFRYQKVAVWKAIGPLTSKSYVGPPHLGVVPNAAFVSIVLTLSLSSRGPHATGQPPPPTLLGTSLYELLHLFEALVKGRVEKVVAVFCIHGLRHSHARI